MPTRKPVELIAMGRDLGWTERELTRKEMMHTKTLHKAYASWNDNGFYEYATFMELLDLRFDHSSF